MSVSTPEPFAGIACLLWPAEATSQLLYKITSEMLQEA
jgi:hypothetical protein